MKKSVKVLWMAAAAAVLAPPCALADDVTVKAKIPFDFQVGERQLPSGEYRFVTREDPGLLLVYSKGTREQLAAVLFNGRMEAERSPWAQLTFHRYGQRHFLKSIRGLSGPGVSLAETPSEVRAEAQARAAAEGGLRAGVGPKAAKTAMP
jgi:hypothetical protein